MTARDKAPARGQTDALAVKQPGPGEGDSEAIHCDQQSSTRHGANVSSEALRRIEAAVAPVPQRASQARPGVTLWIVFGCWPWLYRGRLLLSPVVPACLPAGLPAHTYPHAVCTTPFTPITTVTTPRGVHAPSLSLPLPQPARSSLPTQREAVWRIRECISHARQYAHKCTQPQARAFLRQSSSACSVLHGLLHTTLSHHLNCPASHPLHQQAIRLPLQPPTCKPLPPWRRFVESSSLSAMAPAERPVCSCKSWPSSWLSTPACLSPSARSPANEDSSVFSKGTFPEVSIRALSHALSPLLASAFLHAREVAVS